MTTAAAEITNQAALWNGSAGRAWVETQSVLDQMLEPFQPSLLAAIPPNAASSVLDVGCGTGSTSLAIARRLGPSGHCTGIDISEPMLGHARNRAANEVLPVSFILADAQTYEFEAACFDVIVSRFGVMFFEDSVRAFANLRRAAKPAAALRFVAWRDAALNPFMTCAERVAAPLLVDVPPRRPNEPGQFAFADGERVRDILRDSGWREIRIEPIEVTCTLPEPHLTQYITRLGPVGRVLQAADESVRARFIAEARAAFDPFVYGAEVRFVSACWLVSASA